MDYCGRVINPVNASGQVEGGLAQALGYVVSEEMIYDGLGNLATKKFGEYRIFAEMDGVAVTSAIHNAVGVRLNSTPSTPEKVWRVKG